jgi:stage III sporulation protein AF
MLGFIKDWTVNIVMMVLFVVIVEMLLPRGRMKKYVNLLTGTILIIVIIEPLTGLFGQNFDFSAAQTAAAGNIDRREIEKASKLLEEEQLRQTTELYRRRIIEQITQSAKEVEGVKDAQADVIINEDHDSEYFGEIKRIYITVYMRGNAGADTKAGSNGDSKPASMDSTASRKDDSAREGTIKVDRIESIRTGGMDGDDSGSTVYDAGLERRLTERIGEIFGVETGSIIVKQIQR